MDLKKTLRQLHKIEPDPDYARLSKARILASAIQAPRFTLRVFITGILRSGSTMAVTGLLLLFAVGGFSIIKIAGMFTGLDSSLYAEAQAIDIQIHLADLQYETITRQSLAAPDANFGSPDAAGTGFALGEPDETAPEDESGSEASDVATSTDSGTEPSPDGITEPSTDGTAATSSAPAKPVDVEQALDILTR